MHVQENLAMFCSRVCPILFSFSTSSAFVSPLMTFTRGLN